MPNDEWQEVEASTVELFPWVETMVHHDPKYAKSWVVSERTTGHRITDGKTRREAIEKARRTLETVGEKNTRAQVAKVLERIK